MCEKLGHTCFKSTKHILQFAKATLERGVKVLENTADSEMGLFESETVTMAMGLLTAVMSGASQVTADDRERTKELLPLLETLSKQHPDASVKDMATDLRIAIATHGFVLTQLINKSNVERSQTFDGTRSRANESIKTTTGDSKRTKSNQDKRLRDSTVKAKNDVTAKEMRSDDVTPKKRNSTVLLEPTPNKSVIDILSAQFADLDTDKENIDQIVNDIIFEGKPPKPEVAKKCLIEVIQSHDSGDDGQTSLSDKGDDNELPIDEYPEISNMAYNKDYKPSTVQPNSTSLLEEAFKELLDPLVPVRGHALISLRRLLESRDPETADKQDILLKIFSENLDHNDSYIYLSAIQGMGVLADRMPAQVVPVLAEQYANFDQQTEEMKRTPELRLKLGEVLMKTIRHLGDMLPSCRDMLLHSILQGAKDADELVRASAVSNLAELSKLLKFALDGVIYEIFECINVLIKSDPAVPVRQAAAMFAYQLLVGLGSDSFKVLDSVLRDLYRMLKLAYTVEKDESVIMHISMALQELDQIMTNFLFPKQTLSKKITITESPDVQLGFK